MADRRPKSDGSGLAKAPWRREAPVRGDRAVMRDRLSIVLHEELTAAVRRIAHLETQWSAKELVKRLPCYSSRLRRVSAAPPSKKPTLDKMDHPFS